MIDLVSIYGWLTSSYLETRTFSTAVNCLAPFSSTLLPTLPTGTVIATQRGTRGKEKNIASWTTTVVEIEIFSVSASCVSLTVAWVIESWDSNHPLSSGRCQPGGIVLPSHR